MGSFDNMRWILNLTRLQRNLLGPFAFYDQLNKNLVRQFQSPAVSFMDSLSRFVPENHFSNISKSLIGFDPVISNKSNFIKEAFGNHSLGGAFSFNKNLRNNPIFIGAFSALSFDVSNLHKQIENQLALNMLPPDLKINEFVADMTNTFGLSDFAGSILSDLLPLIEHIENYEEIKEEELSFFAKLKKKIPKKKALKAALPFLLAIMNLSQPLFNIYQFAESKRLTAELADQKQISTQNAEFLKMRIEDVQQTANQALGLIVKQSDSPIYFTVEQKAFVKNTPTDSEEILFYLSQYETVEVVSFKKEWAHFRFLHASGRIVSGWTHKCFLEAIPQDQLKLYAEDINSLRSEPVSE